MADLVIKPSSGNLVLKDDQNVARLTLATSTGNTTFTGATTLANATITAGVFPAGHILQVVSTTTDGVGDSANVNSTSFVEVGLSATITPRATSSKILIMVNTSVNVDDGSSVGESCYTGVKRGSTVLTASVVGWDDGTTHNPSTCAFTYLDSPSTTSATVYEVVAKSNNVALDWRMNAIDAAEESSITLMEIAG